MIDYIILGLDALGFIVALGISHYAFHMISQMHTGRLEKSWKFMMQGAMIIPQPMS